MCDLRFAICDVRCAMCDVRFTICDVRCAMCDVRCAIYDLRDWRRKTIISNIWPEGRPLGLPGQTGCGRGIPRNASALRGMVHVAE